MAQDVEAGSPSSGPTAPGRRSVRWAVGGLTLLVVFGAGLLGGLTVARQRTDAPAAHGHDHAGGEAAPALSARALANLGVEVGSATIGEHVRWVEVPAVLERLPGAERPLTAPVAGRVRRVSAIPGAAAPAGQALVEIVREAFPPPALALTEAIVKPLNEDHHEAAVSVRNAALAATLAERERARLVAAMGPAPEAAAARVLREAHAEVERTRLALDNARHEAERHGMTDEQIAGLARGDGDVVVPDGPDVRRVLLRNRLWSPEADRLLALLPDAPRGLPHTAAVLGELVGAGRLTAELVDAVAAQPALARRFLDVAGLVQQGSTPAALAELARLGALEPVVAVLTPEVVGAPSAPGLDVAEVLVRPGEHVTAGQRLVLLRDEAQMGVALAPAARDVAAVEAALAAGLPLEARPLVAGTGPVLDEVRLLRLMDGTAGADGTALGWASNRLLTAAGPGGEGVPRSWALRPGMRYGVRLPAERKPGRFILPADAIAWHGAETVVLLADGDGFRPVPVRLEHHDADVAVVAADGALFPGDRVVMRGAPALAMALLAQQGGGGGHGHPH